MNVLVSLDPLPTVRSHPVSLAWGQSLLYNSLVMGRRLYQNPWRGEPVLNSHDLLYRADDLLYRAHDLLYRGHDLLTYDLRDLLPTWCGRFTTMSFCRRTLIEVLVATILSAIDGRHVVHARGELTWRLPPTRAPSLRSLQAFLLRFNSRH